MSKHLSPVASKEFDSEVKHAYQALNSLRNTVRLRPNVVGDSYNFRNMGKGEAHERTVSSQDVVPMDVEHGLKMAVLRNWEAPEYTDIFDDAEVNFSEVKELATTIAHALGRRDDANIIESLTTTTNTLAKAGAKFTLADITGAAKALNAKEVPAEDRTFLTDEQALDDLLNDTTITSADYNSVKALVDGKIDSFMGFDWRMVASGRAIGNLGGNAYAYHKSSVGYAIGIDIKTSIDWIATKQSWLSIGILKAGSVLIDTEGAIKIS